MNKREHKEKIREWIVKTQDIKGREYFERSQGVARRNNKI